MLTATEIHAHGVTSSSFNVTVTNQEKTQKFLLEGCQNSKYGGFSKLPDSYPDIMHSFYSLCWLSLSDQSDHVERPFNVPLAICHERIQKFREQQSALKE